MLAGSAWKRGVEWVDEADDVVVPQMLQVVRAWNLSLAIGLLQPLQSYSVDPIQEGPAEASTGVKSGVHVQGLIPFMGIHRSQPSSDKA